MYSIHSVQHPQSDLSVINRMSGSLRPRHAFSPIPPALLHLQDLITPGPVERGFYVASGEWDLLPRVQESLVDLLWRYSLQSSQEANPENKSWNTVRSRRPSQIGQIIWVDSGNVFDPYHISAAAKKRNLDPLRVLRAIKVGRPFTAFQYQQMLERVPNAALWAYPEEAEPAEASLPSIFSRDISLLEKKTPLEVRTPHAVWWTPLVIISDLMGLFYDPELPDNDLYRAFREFLVRLTHLRGRAIVLGLLKNHKAPAGRRHLLPEVLRLSRRISTEIHPRLAAKAG